MGFGGNGGKPPGPGQAGGEARMLGTIGFDGIGCKPIGPRHDGGDATMAGITGLDRIVRGMFAGHGKGLEADGIAGLVYAVLGREICSMRAQTAAKTNAVRPCEEAPRENSTVRKKFGAPCRIKACHGQLGR